MTILRRLPSFARRSALSFGLRFGGLLLQFISSIVIAHALGVSGYGTYSYAFSVAAVIGTSLGFGIVPLAVRELPRYLALQEYSLALGFIVSGFWLILLSGGIAGLLLPLLIWSGTIALEINWLLVVTAAVFQTLILGLSSTLNGFHRVLQSQFIETVLRQGLALATVGCLVLWQYPFTPTRLFTLQTGFAFIVILLLIWRVQSTMSVEAAGPLPPAAYDLRRWLAVGLPLMGVTVLVQVQMNLDVLMIGALTDSADVGRYRVAARGAELVIITNGIALQLLEPLLSRSIALADRAATQRLISHSVAVSVSFSAALTVPLFLGASYYLQLFGAEFVVAAPVLRILVLGHMFGFLSGPTAVILVMSGRERVVFFATLCGVCINLVINFLFIPKYGIFAPAFATVVSGLLVKFALLIVVLRSTQFDPTPGAIFSRICRD